jgi:hypothetical protein
MPLVKSPTMPPRKKGTNRANAIKSAEGPGPPRASVGSQRWQDDWIDVPADAEATNVE